MTGQIQYNASRKNRIGIMINEDEDNKSDEDA